MFSGLLSENVKITKVSDYAGAATTDVESAILDMAGYDGVIFFTSFVTAAANNLIHLEHGDDSGLSDGADILGSEVDLSGASDEDQWIELTRPLKRYVRCVALRGTSTALGDIWAIQFKAKDGLPISNLTSGTIYGKAIGPLAASGTK